MSLALHGQTGVLDHDRALDGTNVLAGYTYCPALAVGIVLQRDVSEVQQPIMIQLLVLLRTAIGIVVIGVAVEGYSARHMLRRIQQTWEESNRIVEVEKESFERLVAAMYAPHISLFGLMFRTSNAYLLLF